jgi:hypothetical protein|tara:strand:- start:438 stop:869 length:432 start_codon:yes stop_codon:yes gene_type:complete
MDNEELNKNTPKTKVDWWWHAPEYFSRWRLFPRAFITMYIYLLWRVVEWFMAIPDPNMNQAGLVSVVVGAGAAWFGLYVNSVSSGGKDSVSPIMRIKQTTTTGSNMSGFNNKTRTDTTIGDTKTKRPRRSSRSSKSSSKFDIK